MSIDNKILELRLVTKDTSIGQASSLGRCAAKLHALKSFSSSESVKGSLESFMREMLLSQIDLNKSCRLLRSSKDQLAEYDRLERSVQEKINSTRNEIHALTVELKQEQEIRKHRIQIESKATEVNQHSSLSSLKRKINEISESMTSTQEAMQSIETDIITRKGQLDQLEEILTLLETKLKHDNDVILEEAEVIDQEGEEWDAGRDDSGGNDYKNDVPGNTENYTEVGEVAEDGNDSMVVDSNTPHDN